MSYRNIYIFFNKYVRKHGLNWRVNSLHISELEWPSSRSCLTVPYVHYCHVMSLSVLSFHWQYMLFSPHLSFFSFLPLAFFSFLFFPFSSFFVFEFNFIFRCYFLFVFLFVFYFTFSFYFSSPFFSFSFCLYFYLFLCLFTFYLSSFLFSFLPFFSIFVFTFYMSVTLLTTATHCQSITFGESRQTHIEENIKIYNFDKGNAYSMPASCSKS